MADGKIGLLRGIFRRQLPGGDPFGITLLRTGVRKTEFALSGIDNIRI